MQNNYATYSVVFGTILVVLYGATRLILKMLNVYMSGIFDAAVLTFSNILAFKYMVKRENGLLSTKAMGKFMLATMFIACIIIGGANSIFHKFIAEPERKFQLVMLIVLQAFFFLITNSLFVGECRKDQDKK